MAAAHNPKPDFVAISYSPWSRRARWALQHYCCQYREVPYAPVTSAFWLRWRLWNFSDRITVPILFDGAGGVVRDSFEIAEWAGRNGMRDGAESLVPADAKDEIKRWNAVADDIHNFGRKIFMANIKSNRALYTVIAPGILGKLGPITDALVSYGCSSFEAKYKEEHGTASREKAREGLQQLQAALKASGGQYVLGDSFTYADIVMAGAVGLAGLPPDDISRVSPLLREAATDPQLAAEFPNLLQWRDGLYRRHWPALQSWGSSSGSAARTSRHKST